MNAETKFSPVEQALSRATKLLTVLEIKAAAHVDEASVRAELKRLAQQGQIEHIPGRGRYDGRYGLLRPIAKAVPIATSGDGALMNEGTTCATAPNTAEVAPNTAEVAPNTAEVAPSIATTAADRELTPEAQGDRDEFVSIYGRDGSCSCCIFPPCESCVHPGNPSNQEEDDSCWTVAGADIEGGETDVRGEPDSEWSDAA